MYLSSTEISQLNTDEDSLDYKRENTAVVKMGESDTYTLFSSPHDIKISVHM